MTKHLKTKFLVFLVLLFVFIFPFLIVSAATTTGPNLEYAPMETLPGFAKTADFSVFISNLYKFGIWTVGICALIMIVIGGYMYAASGGNNASMEKAKTFITDALVGLILALLAYLILYIINPKLIEINMGTTGTTAKISTLADCTGTSGIAPANSSLCSTNSPLTPTPVRLVTACANEPCTYKCNAGWKIQDKACVSEGIVASDSTKAAAIALFANNKVTILKTGDCKDNSGKTVSPNLSLTQATDGTTSTACNSNCKSVPCAKQVELSKNLLNAINTVGTSNPLSVVSLTGGQHALSSTHYSGKAADIITNTKSEWPSIVEKFKNAGCSGSFCDNAGKPVNCTSATHIHITCY